MRRLFKNKSASAGLIVLVLLMATALLAPILAPYDPAAQNLSQGLTPANKDHWLGQDKSGRDVLSRLIYGSRVSLAVGLTASLVSLVIGAALGGTAAYLSGAYDEILCRVIDILLAFPGLLLALALMAILGPSLTNVIVALSAVGWVGYARLTRGQVLALKERGFVTAARALGAGNARIIFLHLLPNALAPLIVEATFGMGGAIVGEAGLSFLGFGVQPPTASWGSMLNEGRRYLTIAPYLTAWPGLAIMIVVMGLNFLGDGLRDVLDPRLKGD